MVVDISYKVKIQIYNGSNYNLRTNTQYIVAHNFQVDYQHRLLNILVDINTEQHHCINLLWSYQVLEQFDLFRSTLQCPNMVYKASVYLELSADKCFQCTVDMFR